MSNEGRQRGPRLSRRLVIAATVAATTLAGGAIGTARDWLAWPDGLMLDLAVAALAEPPGSSDGPVAVVAIDARSLDAPELAAIPRPLFQPVLADLIEATMAADAAAVGFDLLLGYSGNRLIPGHDRSLLAALYRHGDRLVLGRSWQTLPVRSALAAMGFDSQGLGLMELVPDPDGVYRRVTDTADGTVPTLAAATLNRTGRTMPPEVILVPERHPADMPIYALIDVLRCARTDPGSLRRALSGKIVFVGSTLAEEDRKPTSARFLAPSRRAPAADGCLASDGSVVPDPVAAPGVLIHAMAVDAVLRGRVPGRAPPAVLVAGAAVLGLAGGLLGMLAPPLLTAAGVVALALSAWGVTVALLAQSLWYPPAAAMVSLIAAAAVAYPVRYRSEWRHRRRVQTAFRHYLAPALVDHLSSDPSLLRLGGETREVTVLFCDLRGFTTMSERMAGQPEQLVRLLNRLLTVLTDAVLAHGGTVDKYLGDCVMAFWNAPLDDPDHARHAVEAALSMVSGLAALNRELAAEDAGVPTLAVGVGIHTGSAVVGNMGSERRFDYTAIGDTVNLASRLQGECKSYGVEIIVSGATRACVPEVAAVALDRIAVRGRTGEVTLHAVVGDAAFAGSDAFRTARQSHERLLRALQTGDREAALTATDALCEELPSLAGACQGFRRRAEALRPD